MGLASARPLQAAFKSVSDRFVTRINDLCQLIGISLLAAFLHLETYSVFR
ncbi:hypothetical protein yaldo0001_390 [Yersinia aldovae ATCC 35236]|nr:hypothetical protein yaldo0001_390 [Yersinia aldovae ATCC 35236]